MLTVSKKKEIIHHYAVGQQLTGGICAYLGVKNVAISATTEKKKVGEWPYPKVDYYQAKDHFAIVLIGPTFAVERG
ncbi:hypothetical protein [Pontibacter mucosus]|uniref:hypothetical protein n=1 Tax=Pontibacter mucosus TaxID=1649266 RepID=UPI000D375EE5|nr:hypothetical protein [Pontibacter mucosus]